MKEEEKKEINDSIHAMAKMQNIEITIFDQLKARSVSVEPPTIQSPQLITSTVEVPRTNGAITEQITIRDNAIQFSQMLPKQESEIQMLTVVPSGLQTNLLSPHLTHSRKNSAASDNIQAGDNQNPKFRKQSTLNERKSHLSNLKPILIKKPSISAGQSPLIRIPDRKYEDNLDKEIQEKIMKASDGSQTPSLRNKLLGEAKELRRQATIKKFQRTVKLAVAKKKQDEAAHKIFFFNDPVTATLRTNTYLNSRADLILKSPCEEPMTPGASKSKMSFFDVVKSLNPFKSTRKNAFQLDEQVNSERNNEEQAQEIRKKKKERAQHLWKKAKAVLRAIYIWKRIQGEIQLYGTHNYEFRQTFSVAQNSTVYRKQPSYRTQGGQRFHADSRVAGNPNDRNRVVVQTKKKFNTYIHPGGAFKRIWSFIIMCFMVYTGTVMPYRLAFYSTDQDSWDYIDLVSDLVFFSDFLLNFFSAFYNSDGILVTNNKDILMNYLSGWLFIDMAAGIPMNYVGLFLKTSEDNAQQNYSSIIRLFRLPRLYKLVKVSQISMILTNFKGNSIFTYLDEFLQRNQGVIKLIQLSLNGILCVHVAACFWFLTSRLNQFNPQTWVVRNNFIDEEDSRKYLASIYWAVSTVLTVGYGDIHAVTSLEMIVSCIWMMTGVAFYSLTIGVITSVLGKIDSRASQLKSKLEFIDDFCQESKIHHTFKRRIKDALEYHSLKNPFSFLSSFSLGRDFRAGNQSRIIINQDRQIQEGSFIEKYQILNELPPNLKYDIAMQIHGGAIGKLQFFQKKDMTFVGNIVPLLQPLHVLQGETIYLLDDHPYDIYFILNGRVNFLLDASACIFKSWPQGSYFGEIEIIFQKKRICTVQAEEECDLFTLNKKFYHTKIFNDYPEIEKQLRELAIERQAKIDDAICKARAVLDTIGIEKALSLPLRSQGRKTSFGSMNTSLKKRYQLEKISSMRKIAMSFENANNNATASEISKKAVNDEQKSLNSGLRLEKPVDDSSSSGDFNIWGEADNSGSVKDSQDSGQNLENGGKNSKRKRKSKMNKQDSEIQKGEESNFSSFNNYFNTVRKSNVKQEIIKEELRQEGDITEEDEEEEDSSDLEEEVQIMHGEDLNNDDEIKEAEENQEYTEKTPTRKGDNDEQEGIDSFDQVQQDMNISRPMIKILQDEEEKKSLDSQKSVEEMHKVSPFDFSLKSKQQFSSPYIQQLKQKKPVASPSRISLEPLVKKNSSQNKIANLQTISPLNQSLTEPLNTSNDMSKLTSKSGVMDISIKDVGRKLNEKRISEQLKSISKINISPKKQSSTTIDFRKEAVSLQEKRQSSQSSAQISKRMRVHRNVIQIQINQKPASGISTLKVELQALELMSMNKTLKHITHKFKENNKEKDSIQSKFKGLQSTMDLMAKMLKDIHTKQLQKKQSSESHKTGSSKFIRNERNERRNLQMATKMQDLQQQNQNLGGRSRNSEVPLMSGRESGSGGGYIYRQSFTLNSHQSLVPVDRKEKQLKKLQSTSVDEKRKETIRDFSYTDDIEMLQKDYYDVYNQSLPDQ